MKLDAISTKGKFKGKQESDLHPVPLGATKLKLAASRNAWVKEHGKNKAISVNCYISYDAGKTFQLLIGFTAAGGDTFDSSGVMAPESSATKGIKQPDSPDRIIKIEMESYSSIDTEVSVSFA